MKLFTVQDLVEHSDQEESTDGNGLEVYILITLSLLISMIIVFDSYTFFLSHTDHPAQSTILSILPEILFTIFTVLKVDGVKKYCFIALSIMFMLSSISISVSSLSSNSKISIKQKSITESKIKDIKFDISKNENLIEDWNKKGWIGNVRKLNKENSNLKKELNVLRDKQVSQEGISAFKGISIFAIMSVVLRVLFLISNFFINNRIGEILYSGKD